MVISYSLEKPLSVYLKQEQLMASDFLAAHQREPAARYNRKGPEALRANDLSSPFRKVFLFFSFGRLNQWRVPGRTSKEGCPPPFRGLKASSHQSSRLPLRWNSREITAVWGGNAAWNHPLSSQKRWGDRHTLTRCHYCPKLSFFGPAFCVVSFSGLVIFLFLSILLYF